MNTPLRVLLVEDSESDAGLIVRRLQQAGYDLVHERVETADGMRTALAQQEWDIVLADYKMPQFSASSALEILKESGRDLPFIIVSGTIGEEKAVALMQAGAHDYVMKHNLARLVPAVARELKEAEGRREHRRAEEALRQSEERFRLLVENAPDGIFVQTQSRFAYLNPAATRCYGAEAADQLLGQPVLDRFDPSFYDLVRQRIRLINDEKKSVPLVEQIHLKMDGSPFDAELAAVPIRWEGQDGALVFFRDITLRKRAEEALLQSEAALSSILRAAPIGIGLVTHRIFGWTNDHLSRMTGYSSGELQGQSARMLYDSEAEFERVGLVKYEGIKQQGTGSIETLWRRKDGKVIVVFLSSTPIDPLDLDAGVVFTAVDITERQAAIKALRESEERYRTLVENIDLGITLISSDHRVIMTNAATARLFQKSIGEIVGQECFREFEKRDEVCAHCPGTEAMATGKKAVVETTGIRDDGSKIVVRLQAFPHRGPDGHITGFIEVVEDITERKQTEAALQESEERFRLVFEKAPIGIMHYDQTSTVTECNEKFAEIIGAPKEKFIGFNMIRQMRNEKMREAVAASLKGEVGYYEGDYLSVTGGKSTPVKAIYQPIFSPEGVISGGITIFEDITERQRAESELKLKERLLDSASDSIFLYDLEGNFLYINEAAYITRWYRKEELLSLGAWALATPEAAVDQDNILRELWANGELIFESEHRRQDGSVIPVEIFARVLAVEGRELILSVARDITERKQAETQVRQGLDSLHQALQGTVMALANTVELKDPYTAGHQRRVAQLSCAMARELGWSPDRVEGIQVLCFLHDMGKIAVPAEILNKPGKISLTEFGLIKVHPQVGYDILKDIAFPWPVAQGVLQHHERLDGSGYPSGLTAGEITPEAKILAVADVVEAMASHRPYRPALGIDLAIEEITQNRGKLYDPDAVDVCVRLLTEKNFQFD